MGWIAGAACALIAVIAFYTYIQSATRKISAQILKESRSSKSGRANGSEKPCENPVIEKPSPAAAAAAAIPFIVQPSPPSNTRSAAAVAMPTATAGTVEVPAVSVSSTMAMPPPSPLQMGTNTNTNTTSSRSMSPPRLKPATAGPTPPRPGGLAAGALRPPPSAAASLRVPAQKVLQNTSMQPASSSTLAPSQRKVSRQVALAPGHSPMDWAALTADPDNQLRGKDAPPQLTRVTPFQLRAQNGRKGKDAWTLYQGKVYNVTPYVPFHPGGKGEILRGAGKDSAKLFMEVHPWVNWDGMLAECMVGILVGEEVTKETNELDEMD